MPNDSTSLIAGHSQVCENSLAVRFAYPVCGFRRKYHRGESREDDVFRAFMTAAVPLANGAAGIVMVRTVEEALALREAGVGQTCMGEVGAANRQPA